MLTTMQKHIVLLCKGHYQVKEVSFIDSFQRVWAVRCGYGIESISRASLEYIADELYTILLTLNPDKNQLHFQKRLHAEIAKDYLTSNDGLKAIERIILFYRSEIFCAPVREKNPDTGKYKDLFKLPAPKKRLFKRIISGKGVYEDYELINKIN